MHEHAGTETDAQEAMVKVAKVLSRLEYGEVILTVEEGKVVSIETMEKSRIG